MDYTANTELPLPNESAQGGRDRWALFLDFDGTLAHIAPTPAEVTVPRAMTQTLIHLHACLGGALAIISGRPLEELDRFLAPAVLPAAGLHGAESRVPGSPVQRMPVSEGAFARMRDRLVRLVDADNRLLLEDKRLTLALHYRRAPERERDCIDAAREALALAAGDAATVTGAAAKSATPFHMLLGKEVIELKPIGIDKGRAVSSFMRGAPFAGRTPVFAGDDVTDEDAFDAVHAIGGFSIKVGEGETIARWRTASVDTLRAWLERVLERA